MYTIEIIPADRGWILEKIARAIREAVPAYGVELSVRILDVPTDTADLVYFLPESAYSKMQHSISVTYIAHKEDVPVAAKLVEDVARASDCIVTSSEKYKHMLENDGARRVEKIPLGVDLAAFSPVVRIGVVGRTYHTGRKGEHLLAAAMGLEHVEFRFMGEGWPLPGELHDLTALREFYRSIDYMLIPSLIEGGPVPLLEALASGCQVIAATDIGMVSELPHIPFQRGDAEDLKRVIQGLVKEKLTLRKAVEGMGWPDFGRRHLELFKALIDEKQGARGIYGTKITGDTSLSVALVMHGCEQVTLGGPSIRVHNIHQRLTELGIKSKVFFSHLDITHEDLTEFNLFHVFNSWPLDTALATIDRVKRAGRRVVFSPIALDLGELPVWRNLLSLSFKYLDGGKDLDRVLEGVMAATPVKESAHQQFPCFEGVKGHFETLRQALKRSDAAILLSSYEQRLLDTIGCEVPHGYLVPNAVEIDSIDQVNPDLFRTRYGLGQYVLCVGRMEYRKNQALLAYALQGMNISLVFVGGVGDDGYQHHIKKLGGNNVVIVGRVEDRALLASAYAGALAAVLPSWCEGAPLAAIEAGHLGTPLVLSNKSGEQEYFGEFARYVHPADIAGIRSEIEALVTRPESASDRARRAAHVRMKCHMANHVDLSVQAYRETLARPVCSVISESVFAEISALEYFLHRGGHLTGVPIAELNLLEQLTVKGVNLNFVVYRADRDTFVPVEFKGVASVPKGGLLKELKNCNTEMKAQELVVQAESMMITRELATGPLDNLHSFKEKIEIYVRTFLSKIPHAAEQTILKLVRAIRPEFLRHDASAIMQIGSIEQNPGGLASFEIVARDVSSSDAAIPDGARLFTFGQGWLSNQALLKKLVTVTRSKGLRLEPYVFDLTYFTAGHLTGWQDNSERCGRLLEILSVSSTVYTESRQVAAELEHLRIGRGFSYKIVPTTLAPKKSDKKRVVETEKPYVLYVSSFNRRKNHQFLINVWRELYESFLARHAPEVQLLLVGEVQEELMYADPEYVRSLEQLNIRILSGMDDNALDKLLARCLFTVYPSVKEGWGIPVQESLEAGKVCLVSNKVPIAEELHCAALIKLDPDDFFGWYEALKTWITNERLRKSFGAEALKCDPGSWSDAADRILKSW
jgi:glycosyltransferase involved in cell wall biosynthesis